MLGDLARLTKSLDAADRHTARAVEQASRANFRPTLGWLNLQWSDILIERNRPGDHEKARKLQDEALSIARELGMKPLTERILKRRQFLKA